MFFVEDEYLAKNLQDQYNYKKKPHYEDKLSSGHNQSNVISTQLEYTDPTPSIHDLFVQFNKKFFWGKLLTVVVKWSTRMTSCAGVCSYQGRRGLCTISLSAPLLSLRPRKDLVETLLHEMIHAYLFITDNDDDRDGHGPAFHSHMNRINKEAGTNISVYHSFHDEVEYHQRHVWRCDGECQKKKPYFGIVRRASNRPPGPNDFWWPKHQMECGGKFIKISEPESTKRTKKHEKSSKGKATSVQNIKDIRTYFPNEKSSSSKSGLSSNIHGISDLSGPCGSSQSTSPGFNKVDNRPQATSNIYGFNDLSSGKTIGKGRAGGMLANKGGGTLVINKPNIKPNIKQNNDNTSPSCSSGKCGNGKSLSTPGSHNVKRGSENVRDTVRNIWANKKYNETKDDLNVAFVDLTDNAPVVPVKKPKVSCPVCNLNFIETEMDAHLDDCLSMTSSPMVPGDLADDVTCPVCNVKVRKNLVDEHLSTCLESSFEEDITDVALQNKVPEEIKVFVDCPVCSKKIVKTDLNDHLENCLNCSFVNEDDNFEADEKEETECQSVPCPCCMKWFPEGKIYSHIDDCLTAVALENNFFD